jgi:signal transduction histidine kinase
VDALERQNRELRDQVKLLVRAEQRIYRFQREAEGQLRRTEAVNAFALDAAGSFGPDRILSLGLEMLFRLFPYEQGVGLCVDGDTLVPSVTHAVHGCEEESVQAIGALTWRMPVDRPLPRGPVAFGAAAVAGDPELARFAALIDELFRPNARPASLLLLPLRQPGGALGGALLLANRTGRLPFHDELPSEKDVPFLQLVASHVESALYNAVLARELAHLAADLEVRVARRTAELAEANERLDANLRQLRDAQDQLLQAGKMAALGTLAAGLSHELNNPIGVILGYAQLLQTRDWEDPQLARALAAIERQAKRCAQLISSLLDYSRVQPRQRELVSIATLLERVTMLTIGPSKQVSVPVHVASGEGLPLLEVSRTEIESALLNLVGNALDATPPNGRVEVRAAEVDRDGRPGVLFEVEDNGSGIAPEVMPRIFDPFFTTKDVGKGTGLGLSLTRRVVESHGGTIDVVSAVGRGTAVKVWLPAAGGRA